MACRLFFFFFPSLFTVGRSLSLHGVPHCMHARWYGFFVALSVFEVFERNDLVRRAKTPPLFPLLFLSLVSFFEYILFDRSHWPLF